MIAFTESAWGWMVDAHGALFIFTEVLDMNGFWGEDGTVFKGVTRYWPTKLH